MKEQRTSVLPHALLDEAVMCETVLADERIAVRGACARAIVVAENDVGDLIEPLLPGWRLRLPRRSCPAS